MLKWKKFPVLNDGFVTLVDVMGDDGAIVQAARVSYGAGTKKVSDDRALIRYLLAHNHTSPFEMCEVKLLVRVPMDVWRQWIRHRTANVNEYSTRYSEAIDSRSTAKKWRLQSTLNKQGSTEGELEWPDGYSMIAVRSSGDGERFLTVNRPIDNRVHGILSTGEITPGEYLSHEEQTLHELSEAVYKERLLFGVAREQARKDLPLSTYTEAYWKIDLHNLLHFLKLRMDSHAQEEIRAYANIIGYEIVANLFPLTWEAFLDYRFNSISLSDTEIRFLRGKLSASKLEIPTDWGKSEKSEFINKLARLGLS